MSDFATSAIRPIAICVFWKDGAILVLRGYDRVKGDVFYRPPGGGIEFGERGAETVAREIREEMGTGVSDVHEMAVIENIFTFEGRPMHEIVMIYEGRLDDPEMYMRESFTAVEDDGLEFEAVWKDLRDFEAGELLYPSGLLDLLRRRTVH